MLRIDRDTLYTRQDLANLLQGSGVDVDFFIARANARKVFRLLWLGADIIDGLRNAPALSERKSRGAPAPKNRGNRRRRGANQSGGALDRIIQEARQHESP